MSALSGGERRRLALARTVVSGANFLVLDEPTNHLDIESREALEDALEAYQGTLLLVSHDRALIEALATRTLSIEDGQLVAREGAFGDYARAHDSLPAHHTAMPPPPSSVRPAPKPKPKPARQKASRTPAARPAQRASREAARLEREIAALEEELGAIQTRLSAPDEYRDDEALAADGHRHQAVQEELAYKYRDWERHAAEAG